MLAPVLALFALWWQLPELSLPRAPLPLVRPRPLGQAPRLLLLALLPPALVPLWAPWMVCALVARLPPSLLPLPLLPPLLASLLQVPLRLSQVALVLLVPPSLGQLPLPVLALLRTASFVLGTTARPITPLSPTTLTLLSLMATPTPSRPLSM